MGSFRRKDEDWRGGRPLVRGSYQPGPKVDEAGEAIQKEEDAAVEARENERQNVLEKYLGLHWTKKLKMVDAAAHEKDYELLRLFLKNEKGQAVTKHIEKVLE